MAYRALTNTQTDTDRHTQTDKKVKIEGPKSLSNDIFYHHTLITGGPINTFPYTCTQVSMSYQIYRLRGNVITSKDHNNNTQKASNLKPFSHCYVKSRGKVR